MWAVEYRRHGGPEVLEIIERPVPDLRRGQALVRVLASCVSRIDARYMHGRLPHGIGFPKQVGFDAIGQVVDANGTGLGEGSWVAIVLGLEPLTRRGTSVEMLAIEPSRCGVFPPDYTPDPQDCALALGGLTALKAVRDVLRTQPGQRLLVLGAGGPVGLAAIQIAARHGATVDAVAGQRALTTCRDLGAQEAWDHRDDLEEIQSSRGYDGMVAAAGRPAEWLTAVRPGGRTVVVDGGAWPATVAPALRQHVTSLPVAAGHASQDLAWLARAIAARELMPVVGSWHSPKRIRSAYEELDSGNTLGARLIDHSEMP
ncbi:quinone oxidoreductase family protein [Propionibacterium australiense]|uniref:Polyketide synthase, enoylreductase domain n=1 Tax=Propionibacterium australiense TaxID=119981 RepID=A0A383S3L0_9ACTN|nr:zinc-binding dehydrogenase [Propionibacterium australiense]RLP11558.1 zinc-binding dehydrogenase [Propionibacterium australiense]RLP12708.1 zinc-binding dehydrogenase [Propionibacterium australiense]SYZ32271.1 Polyketide synthase, enoylreductase domain [Propionibacterium australiense]VEH90543.1 Zinc-type alcohol dehydrogenase-like protein SA1988 [Propionibacterium australiense]